jgi:hypothetical protein
LDGKYATHKLNTNQLAALLNKLVTASPAPDTENVGRLNFRIELDVILATAPRVARVAEQIVHLIYVAFHLSELIDRHIDVRILFAMRIEIHNDENDVVASGSHLAIKEDCVIIGVIKPQVIVKLKRPVFSPDFVLTARSNP